MADSADFTDVGSGNTVKSQETAAESDTLYAVLQFLKKNNFKETEELLRKEAKRAGSAVSSTVKVESDVSQALAAYKSDEDPFLYDQNYTNLKAFIESCLDVHKVELNMVLYPVFVHMYLELTYNSFPDHAREFFDKFSVEQEEYYRNDLIILSSFTTPEQMLSSQLMENFKSSKFVIRMSRDSYNHLKRHLQDKHMASMLSIIQDYLFIDVYDGVPRSKEQINAYSGGILGEATREANKVKMYYGLLKEPELNIPLDEEEDTEGEDKPKKKKTKREGQVTKKSKTDPQAPSATRIPLPELRDTDKLEKITAYKDGLKAVKVSPTSLPSILFYGIYNSQVGVTSVDISENAALMSTGFADSSIKVWSLTPDKLYSMKTSDELELLDKDGDCVLENMMDTQSATTHRTLHAHSGPVYSTSFSPERNLMLSASEDGTVRLWSLKVWAPLVVIKGHNFPVWDVEFSPHGHYFVSAGHDRTVRLWATDTHQPLRLFCGHLSDVDSVCYHPNSNYIATGSSDRTVRVWDVLNGDCVRYFTGHKGAIHKVCFSPDGKYLTSAGTDGIVILWDLANGTMVSQLKAHKSTVYSLGYSRDCNMLASGGIDGTVKLWDVRRVFDNIETDADSTVPSSIHVNDDQDLLLQSYSTKSSSVLHLHFTRTNLLLASGSYVT